MSDSKYTDVRLLLDGTWQQNTWDSCLLAGVGQALFGSARTFDWTVQLLDDVWDLPPEQKQVLGEVAKAVALRCPASPMSILLRAGLLAQLPWVNQAHFIVQWNDQHGRTWEEVETVLLDLEERS